MINDYALPAIMAPLIRIDVKLHVFAKSKPPITRFAVLRSLDEGCVFGVSSTQSIETV